MDTPKALDAAKANRARCEKSRETTAAALTNAHAVYDTHAAAVKRATDAEESPHLDLEDVPKAAQHRFDCEARSNAALRLLKAAQAAHDAATIALDCANRAVADASKSHLAAGAPALCARCPRRR